MPDNSAILALPYIQPSQAQKHVTHNEALSLLDVLVQLGVVGFGATTAPSDPAEGETHALGATPTGAWAGQGDTLASWRDGVWNFIAPLAGWRAWGTSEGELRIWDGAAWVLPVAGTENLDGVGINTTSDATNRLSVKAEATLLSHDGGDHQLKINKNTAADTATVLFQSGWTGHAEMGLSGNTDFAIKVSDDGTSWSEALRFDGANGKASGDAVQSGTTDATSGRLMTVGAFGLGGKTPELPGGDLSVTDNSISTGLYAYRSAVSVGGPTDVNRAALLHTRRAAGGGETQIMVVESGSGIFASAGNIFSRARVTGAWGSWERSVQNRHIIGSVSQSGGIPTGAVIEQGSNANGEYVRFADGTQICTQTGITLSYASVNIISKTWTFPAAFIAKAVPAAILSNQIGDYTNVSIRDLGIMVAHPTSLTSAVFNQYRVAGATGTWDVTSEATNVRISAIGRWF